MFNLAGSWQQHFPLPCAPLIRRPPQPTLKIVRGYARRQMNIAAGAEKRLGDLGALVRAFHVEDEKAVRWPLSRPKYVASGLNFSMKAEIAFCSTPDFSASLPWVASSLSLD